MVLGATGGKNCILIISHDVVGAQMAGPGIRYYNLAQILCREFETILAIPPESPLGFDNADFQIAPYQRHQWVSLESLAKKAKIILFAGDTANEFPQLRDSDAALVVDGYDPLLAEWLALVCSLNLPEELTLWANRMVALSQQILLGDFFVCASERQRDWWLGRLEAVGRINPYMYREDPSLRQLVDLVPFGLPAQVPRHTRQVIKGIWPGIAAEDRVILWGGGLWPWLDPVTAIRAVAQVWQKRQDVRLIFPGTKHPNPILKDVHTQNEMALQVAKDLGVLNQAVFFGDWIPYTDWPNVLLESDLALTLHYDTYETRLAFRSRVLDYIWAGLPIVATHGDATSELIDHYRLGVIVDYKAVEQVAEAVLHLLEIPRSAFEISFENARQNLTWARAAQPLVKFCQCPRRAPDRSLLEKDSAALFYQYELSRLQTEMERLKTLVEGYEQGHFIRFMRWLRQLSKHLKGGHAG